MKDRRFFIKNSIYKFFLQDAFKVSHARFLSESKTFGTFMDCLHHVGAQLVVRFVDGQVQLIETEMKVNKN